jgi:hypothetical protein
MMFAVMLTEAGETGLVGYHGSLSFLGMDSSNIRCSFCTIAECALPDHGGEGEGESSTSHVGGEVYGCKRCEGGGRALCAPPLLI